MSHDALLDEGWQRQTTIAEPRLSELAENYRALGYEVLIVHDGVTAGCGECFKNGSASTLYIRLRADAASDGDDELFAP